VTNIIAFIVVSTIAYLISFIAISLAGSSVGQNYNQLLLVVSYLPFIVLLAWASLIGVSYFRNKTIPLKEAIIAFGIHGVIFLGWATVMLIHFSIFKSHV